jgi:hypothetical protein
MVPRPALRVVRDEKKVVKNVCVVDLIVKVVQIWELWLSSEMWGLGGEMKVLASWTVVKEMMSSRWVEV